jgi:hypothetical protein
MDKSTAIGVMAAIVVVAAILTLEIMGQRVPGMRLDSAAWGLILGLFLMWLLDMYWSISVSSGEPNTFRATPLFDHDLLVAELAVAEQRLFGERVTRDGSYRGYSYDISVDPLGAIREVRFRLHYALRTLIFPEHQQEIDWRSTESILDELVLRNMLPPVVIAPISEIFAVTDRALRYSFIGQDDAKALTRAAEQVVQILQKLTKRSPQQ